MESTSHAEKGQICLDVRNLVTSFKVGKNYINAVDNCSFQVRKGKTLGIVGESGCGKSVTSLSVMGLVPIPPGRIAGGEIIFDNMDLLKLANDEMRTIRGNKISMIFQEPMTALNPLFTIGNQVSESFMLHRGMNRAQALESSIEMLKLVKIPSPEKRVHDYPHQLSGGMRQRVMIAMALACEPELLIADEPTTALDVTIQAQILALMNELQLKKRTSIMLITHDLGVVAETCDDVVVMYAGRIVEKATAEDLFNNPKHPYAQGLLRAIPQIGVKTQRLETIKGMVPRLDQLPAGCRFAERCPKATDECHVTDPELREVSPAHFAACIHC